MRMMKYSGAKWILLQDKTWQPSRKKIRKGDGFQGWDGEDGVIKHLIQHFFMKKSARDRNRIRRVLVTIREFARRWILYKGQRIKGQGRKPLISSPQEYQILID
jgi:hypothetical protein